MEAVASQLSRLALKFNGYDKEGKAGNGGREDEDGGGLAMSRPVRASEEGPGCLHVYTEA